MVVSSVFFSVANPPKKPPIFNWKKNSHLARVDFVHFRDECVVDHRPQQLSLADPMGGRLA